ncbi:hypothetical protein H257_02054 [Aphanomyces astaci]|uniref:Sugar phosphate transporter domain-containing protein n=2 Tax=Aphanomyces astaci TaxID=112090 RepID=W4H6X4_APHAT|nr:hypothetical protein H257_02054 [Aphanomyces astaci]ETV87044.1 hypothetical protein H257_02054 [Aphanomyces astaci]|eukprot:XP_009823843.1 hypothetical protein H257_02054 [Aphanomyces astaci]
MGCHDGQLMTMPPDLERATSAIVLCTGKHDRSVPLAGDSCCRQAETSTMSECSLQLSPPSKPASQLSLMLFVFTGIMASFTINGMALESLTNVHAIGEQSLTMITAFLYAVVAIGLKKVSQEPKSTLPAKHYIFLSVLSYTSTLASVLALRYVSFITRILGKSCKSIPVMLLGVVLGKRYAVKKYVSVVFLSLGVAVFLVGSAHHSPAATLHSASTAQDIQPPRPVDADPTDLAIGMALLVVSLLCDGATGALEDKYMHDYAVGTFDLMFQLSGYKALWAAVGVVASGELPDVMSTVTVSIMPLLALSLSGAIGQAFLFFSINKFGALTTAIVGTVRKVLSVALSVVLFHHVLSGIQLVGLAVVFGAIGLNWVRFDVGAWAKYVSCRRAGRPEGHDAAGQDEVEMVLLMPPSNTESRPCETTLECDDGVNMNGGVGNVKAMQALVRWDQASATATRSCSSTTAV